MEEIRVGEYVRTEHGKIGKYTYREKGQTILCIDFGDYKLSKSACKLAGMQLGGNIVKHSPNIIDLIEVGDYVNGGQVREKTKDFIRIAGGNLLWEYLENEQEIKTILTKEQYKANCYEVK